MSYLFFKRFKLVPSSLLAYTAPKYFTSSTRKMSPTENRVPIEINNENDWETIVKNNSQPVLVDFAAEWCGPCRMLAPILAEVMKDFPNIVFTHLDIDKLNSVASKYEIQGVPTVILFSKGKPQAQFVGLKNKAAVQQWLQTNAK